MMDRREQIQRAQRAMKVERPWWEKEKMQPHYEFDGREITKRQRQALYLGIASVSTSRRFINETNARIRSFRARPFGRG